MATPPNLPGPQTGPTPTQGMREPRPVKTEPAYQPSEDEKEIVRLVNERINFTTRESARWALERQMFETIAFSQGIQWLEYTESTRKFSRWNAPAWFPTPVQNEMKPRLQSMVARILRSRPQARVRPDTNDPKDREGARVGEKFVGHFDDVTFEDEKRQEAAVIAGLMGTVVAEDFWNPNAGPIMVIPQQEQQQLPVKEPAAVCPQCQTDGDIAQVGQLCPTCSTQMDRGERPKIGPNGQPLTQTQWVPKLGEDGQPIVDEVRQGEIETRMRMLFNFFHDPKATNLRESRWAGDAQYADLDWVDENFPEWGPYVAEESGIDASNFYESSLLALIGPSIQGTAHYGGSSLYRNGAVVRRYQEKPSKKRPHGLYAVVANNVLLYQGPLPITDTNGIPTGDLTYTEFKYDIVPGRFAGSTPAEDMVPLQRQVNGITAQKIINRKTLMNPWVLAPKGCGLNPGQVAMRPAATVMFNPVMGLKPEVIPGIPLPEQVDKEKADCIVAMDRLAQDARIGHGEMPSGVKSGVALSFLKEQGDEASAPRLQRWGQWIAERNRKRLLLAQRYYKEPRAVKIGGPGSEWQVRLFMGADLHGQTDVSVDPGSLMPRSQAARQQLMMDAIENKIIDLGDQFQRQRVIEELGLTQFETAIGPDRRRAQKENATMDEGMPVGINPTDNTQVHVVEHTMAMQDPAFDSKPDMVKAQYQQHLQAHQQQQQVEQQAALAQQKQQAEAGIDQRPQNPEHRKRQAAAAA